MSKEKLNSLDRLKLSEKALGCLKNAGINDLDRLSDIDIDLEKLNKICFMKQDIVKEIVTATSNVGIKFAPPLDIKDSNKSFNLYYSEDINKIGQIEEEILTNIYKNNNIKSILQKMIAKEYDVVIKEYIKKFRNKDLKGDELIIRKKLTKTFYENKNNNEAIANLENYIWDFGLVNFADDDDYKVYKKSIFKKLKNYLEENKDNMIADTLNNQIKEYDEEQYKFKEMAKEELRPTIIFIESKLKELSNKNKLTSEDKATMKNLTMFLKLWKEFPQKFMEQNKPKKNDKHYVSEYFDKKFNPHQIILTFGYRKNNVIGPPVYEKVFASLSDTSYYLEENFYYKCDPVDTSYYVNTNLYDESNFIDITGLDTIPFTSFFIKICKDLSENKNDPNYSKEVYKFLKQQLVRFYFQDESELNEEYLEDISEDIDEFNRSIDDRVGRLKTRK